MSPQKLVDVGHTGRHHVGLYLLGVIGPNVQLEPRTRVAACNSVKRRNPRGSRYLVVPDKLGKRQHPDPVVLEVVDVSAKILLHGGVDSLGLSVRLRVEGRGKARVHAQAVAQMSPKVRGELRAAVRDDGVRQAVESEYMIEEKMGKPLGLDGISAWDEVALLGQPIDHDPDGVEPLGLREANHEIHGDVAPRVVWHGKRKQGAVQGVASWLDPSANMAVRDETLDVLVHSRPEILTG